MPIRVSALSQQGYPTNLANSANVTAASNLSAQARYIPSNLPTGYVQSYHLTVQRQFGRSSSFEVSYVGEHGVKIQVLSDLNQAAAERGDCHLQHDHQLRLPYARAAAADSNVHHHRADLARRPALLQRPADQV